MADEKPEDLNTGEGEEVHEIYFEETPRESYIVCATNAFNSIESLDPMLYNAAIQRRIRRIKRNAIIIFDIILEEMAQELQEIVEEEE